MRHVRLSYMLGTYSHRGITQLKQFRLEPLP